MMQRCVARGKQHPSHPPTKPATWPNLLTNQPRKQTELTSQQRQRQQLQLQLQQQVGKLLAAAISFCNFSTAFTTNCMTFYFPARVPEGFCTICMQHAARSAMAQFKLRKVSAWNQSSSIHMRFGLRLTKCLLNWLKWPKMGVKLPKGMTLNCMSHVFVWQFPIIRECWKWNFQTAWIVFNKK